MQMSDYLEKLSANAEQAARTLGLLANSRRLMLLCHLLGADRSVGELCEYVNLSHSAVSQHLAKLRAEGVVRASRVGKEVFYTINDPQIKQILTAIHKVFCS